MEGSSVLVVEDEAVLAFEMITFLRMAGAQVVGPAMSLERALELAKTRHIDCAILDVRLRDGLVFPAAATLRERGVGLVFYTGQGDPDEIKRNWPEAQVFLKPAPIETLISAVISACRAK